MTVEDNHADGHLHPLDRAQAATTEGNSERFPISPNGRTALAGLLSGGEQQMLAIARAPAIEAQTIVARRTIARPGAEDDRCVLTWSRRLRNEGLTVLLVETESPTGTQGRKPRLI